MYITGQTLGGAGNPSRSVLAYEDNPQPFHNTVSVLFLDGHVERIGTSDLPALLAAASHGPAPSSAEPPASPGAGGNPGR